MRWTKEHWARLEKWERAKLMDLLKSDKEYGSLGGGGYLPDDCSECKCCGEAMLGTGLCSWCYSELKRLEAKMGVW